MRIFMVMSGTHCGDSERYQLSALRGFKARGINATVCCPERGPLSRYCERLGVTPLTSGRYASYDPCTIMRFAAVLRSRRVDAVLLQHPGGTVSTALAARMANVPCVAVAHATRHVKALQYADMTVTPSRQVAQTLIRHLRLGHPVHVAPPGIDLGVLPPLSVEHAKLRCGFDPTVVRVGVFGALTPDAKQEHVIRAWGAVVQHFPWARLLVVGDGPCRAALEAEAQHYPLRGRVEFQTEAHDLRLLVNACDLVVLPGPHAEVTTVALEAMGRGRPVIAAQGVVPELVEHGHHGLCVPPNRPDALADVLLTLLKHPGYAERLGAQARVHVSDAHSLTAQVEPLLDCLHQVCARRATMVTAAV